MLVEILREKRTVVQSNSEEICDCYEDLITELHKFLDRLVAESGPRQEIFINGADDE